MSLRSRGLLAAALMLAGCATPAGQRCRLALAFETRMIASVDLEGTLKPGLQLIARPVCRRAAAQ